MSGWQRKAMCKCGQTFKASFGDIFFVWEECCPKCGALKKTFVMRTIRWTPAKVEGPWWNRKTIQPGHWEIKA